MALSKETNDEIWQSLGSLKFSNYSVSTYGRVRNDKMKRILKGFKGSGGYPRVRIINDSGNAVNYGNHFIVATIFIPNPENKPTIDHIDRDPSNNHVNNLRWATYIEQSQNQRRTLPKYGRPVYQIDPNDQTNIKRWDKVIDAVTAHDLDRDSIREACKRENKIYGGFLWKFCDEVDQIEGEEWRDVPYPEYEPMQASNLGRVKKINTGRIFMRGNGSSQYLRISVKKITGGTRCIVAHQFVIAAFKGRQDHLLVNHINGDKKDNRIENLEYVTRAQNNQHAYDIGLNKNAKPVIHYDMNMVQLGIYPSVAKAAIATGISSSGIHRVCRGEQSQTKGSKWQYVTQQTAT